jgi:hypothetical protein
MTIVHKAIKKPIVVEVVQFTGEPENILFLEEWSKGNVFISNKDPGKLYVETIEGQVYTYIGSYIVKGVAGEVWPIRKDIFEETYEILKEKVWGI